MMHYLFLLQKNMWEFTQLLSCHLYSWRCGFQCITSCTPVERLLSLEQRHGNAFCNKELRFTRKP